jgi:hypothetical protein
MRLSNGRGVFTLQKHSKQEKQLLKNYETDDGENEFRNGSGRALDSIKMGDDLIVRVSYTSDSDRPLNDVYTSSR